MKKRHFTASLLLHSLLMLGLIVNGANGGKGKGDKEDQGKQGDSAQQEPAKILPKDGDGEPKEIEITLIQRTTPKDKSDNPGERCKGKNYYGGVGLIQELFTGKVIEVAKGYPAERAGILPGDIIITGEEIKGLPGSTATITVARGVEIITFQIVREKICIEEMQKP